MRAPRSEKARIVSAAMNGDCRGAEEACGKRRPRLDEARKFRVIASPKLFAYMRILLVVVGKK